MINGEYSSRLTVWASLIDFLHQAVCSDCGGTVIEYDHAAGNGFCVTCGTVVEENTIVNEIAFGEAASGAAIVQGSFVAQGASMLLLVSYYVCLIILQLMLEWEARMETGAAVTHANKPSKMVCVQVSSLSSIMSLTSTHQQQKRFKT